MAKTCIIGGGITGLSIAWELHRRGEACIVLESSKKPGGAMQSFREGSYLAEEGPNSILLNSAAVEDFLMSIPDLKERIIKAKPEAKKRFIVKNAKLETVPMNPFTALTTPLWSFPAKLRVLKEPFIKASATDKDQSVADFVKNRLGNELYRYAINPLVGGIYAGKPEKLSLRYAFPKLYALEQDHGSLIRGALANRKARKKSDVPKKLKSRIVSFKDGINELPTYIAKALGDSFDCGVHLKMIRKNGQSWIVRRETSSGIEIEDRFDTLISTVPAHRLLALPFDADILASFEPLRGIHYAPVSVLSLGFRREQIKHPLDGFGALIPECEQRQLLGILFPSSVFPGRAPEGSVTLTAFIGGDRQPELATSDREALLAKVLPELEDLIGLKGKPTFIHHRYWEKAIPQYTIGYGRYLNTLQSIEKNYDGLRLNGNYRTGISVTNCIEAALNIRTENA